MDREKIKQGTVIIGHAFVAWALCGAIMGIGPTFMPMETTLIVHAIGAPIIFAAVSWNYFTRFGFTTPLQTAILFTSFAVFMDVVLVAWLIMGSFEMFTSIIGTWLPFVLMFTGTYLTGLAMAARRQTLRPAG